MQKEILLQFFQGSPIFSTRFPSLHVHFHRITAFQFDSTFLISFFKTTLYMWLAIEATPLIPALKCLQSPLKTSDCFVIITVKPVACTANINRIITTPFP